MTKFYFLHSTIFTETKNTKFSSCDLFIKFIISVRGSYCDYLPHAPNNLAIPLQKYAALSKILQLLHLVHKL